MNICIVNHGLANGGTDSFVLNLVRGLIQDGHHVTIALAVNPSSGKQFREDEALSLGAEVVKLSDLGSIREVFRYISRLYKFLKQRQFDVFHANMDLFNGVNMLVARLAGIRVRVCHSHTSQSQYEATSKKHLLVSAYRGIMRWLLWHFSTARCGCSKIAMDYLFKKKWKSDSNSFVVYNGIDLERFENPHCSTSAQILSASPVNKTLITVGRIDHVKNPFFTLNVMKELHSIDPEYHLLWVGAGGMKDEIAHAITELGLQDSILLLGARADVPELLHQASTFLFPSLFEGLSIALIEAQAAGLICIASDTVSSDIDVGKCVFLSLKESPKYWAAQILSVQNQQFEIDREKLAQFDAKHMVAQLEQIYLGN